MPDYRLSKPHLPINGLVICHPDTSIWGPNHGFVGYPKVFKTGAAFPNATGLAADFHEKPNVWLFDISKGLAEPLPLYRTTFEDEQSDWDNGIHQEGRLIVLLLAEDFRSFPTAGDAFDQAWCALVPLTIRVTADGVGTRGPD